MQNTFCSAPVLRFSWFSWSGGGSSSSSRAIVKQLDFMSLLWIAVHLKMI